MADYTFRRYGISDADRCVALFSECFGKERRPDEWKWLYHDCPQGQRSIVCSHENDIAGFYGVVCRRILLQGREILAGHALDVMTHPKHQGKGVFSGCAKAAFLESKRTGVDLFFGFPNKLASPGHRKVNWSFLGKRNILKRAPAARVGTDRTAAGDVSVFDASWESLEGIEAAIDGMGLLNPGGLGFVGDRGTGWIRWRYGWKPGHAYSLAVASEGPREEPAGWVVYRSRMFQGTRVGHIVDYAASRNESGLVEALLDHATVRLSSEGCEFIQCLEDPHNGIQPLEGGVWRTEAERELPLIIRATDPEGAQTPALGLGECRLTLGDCDVF